MEYNILPFGEIWQSGIFNVPTALIEKYIKLASEYQLKSLLLILGNNGVYSSELIAKKLGITLSEADEFMEFWVAEGVAAVKGEAPKVQKAEPAQKPIDELKNEIMASIEKKSASTKKKSVRVSAPTLTPKDIVCAINESPEISELLNEAQVVLGRTISHAESEMLVNLVNFYGLSSAIILMILGYCKQERERNRDKKIGTAYIMKIAENWLDEGIDTIALAEEKLKSIEKTNKYWNEITALAGIRHKNPTDKQRAMVLSWYDDFSLDMITVAIDKMKENTDSPKLSYVDSILKSWKKKGVKTPEDIEKEDEEFEKSKTKPLKKNPNSLSRKPTYDLEKIKQDAMNNTEIKF